MSRFTAFENPEDDDCDTTYIDVSFVALIRELWNEKDDSSLLECQLTGGGKVTVEDTPENRQRLGLPEETVK